MSTLHTMMSKKKKKKKERKPYYPLSVIKDKISKDDVVIRKNALESAENDFRWDDKDILDAINKLQPKHFYKTDPARHVPSRMIDFYKVYSLKGEDVYIHLYIHEDINKLVISSFKKLIGEGI